MTPQEERLILELHSKWGNRFDYTSNFFMFFHLVRISNRAIYIIKLNSFMYLDGQELQGKYPGEQTMK